MAYSQIKTPRFYVDYLQYLNSIGAKAEPESAEGDGIWNGEVVGTTQLGGDKDIASLQSKLWGLSNYKPFSLKYSTHTDQGLVISVYFSQRSSSYTTQPPNYGVSTFLDTCNYFAIFGHNFASQGLRVLVRLKTFDASSVKDKFPGVAGSKGVIYNGTHIDSGWYEPQFDGVSIFSFEGFNSAELYDSDPNVNNINSLRSVDLVIRPYDNGAAISWTEHYNLGRSDPQLSGISLGRFFDMPFAPDLKVSQSKTYETRRHETKGGKVLSKPKNARRPLFNGASEFNLAHKSGDSDDSSNAINIASPYLSRTGRKSWDIKYSHIQDTHIMGYNESSTPWTPWFVGDYDTTQLTSNLQDFKYNLNNRYKDYIDNTDFYSKVIHLTQGRLPFIFQSDNSSRETSSFHICDFDQESFSNKQVASGVYETSMNIKEVW